MSENKNNIISIDSYKGTQLEKSYKNTATEAPKLSLVDQANAMAKSCNENFAKKVVTEKELEKAFEQLDNVFGENLEKAKSDMTFERTGELGDYSYSLIEKSKKTPSDEEMEKMSKMEKGEKKAYMEKMGYSDMEKAEEEEEEEEEMEEGMTYKGKKYSGKDHDEMMKGDAGYKKAYEAEQKSNAV